jgi:arsenate reductase
MSEIGIDISGRHSRSILEFTGRPFGFVVTLCGTAREVCPVFPGAGECIYRAFEDPSGIARSEQESIEPYRRVRDEIKQWVKIRFGRGLKEHNRIGPDLTGD